MYNYTVEIVIQLFINIRLYLKITYILLKIKVIKVIFEIKSVFNLIIVILDFIRYICERVLFQTKNSIFHICKHYILSL